MKRSVVMALFVVFFATSAMAKSHNGAYPMSCGNLWSAVTDTLGDPGHYEILASNSVDMKAYFVIVGALYPGTQTVYLKPRDNRCELNLHIGFTGIDEEYAFRRRVSRSLAKLNAAKSAPGSRAEEKKHGVLALLRP
jgi:hypothetical protein